jgi:ketosteroid isomerase-like protein
MFLERANAGDVSAVVALYEPGAVLAFPPGEVTVGTEAIREVYERFLASRPVLTSEGQSPPLVNGDIALTSTCLPGGGATVEIARRQPDGTWLWAIDQPRIAAPAPACDTTPCPSALTTTRRTRLLRFTYGVPST